MYINSVLNIQCIENPIRCSPMNNMNKNKSTGRKKRREVKPIDETIRRQVTFSKRRVGVFKKASELCVLTGAQVVVLCESVRGRVFAFAHPSVEHVVDEYLGNNNSSELSENNSPCMHEELKEQYLEITKEVEIEKKKSENLSGGVHDKVNKNKEEGDFWWQQPFDHLEEEELEKFISSMEKLMNNLKLRADDLRLIRTSSSMFDASNNSLNSNDAGSSDEYLANKNLSTTKDCGLPDEFFANKSLNKQSDGVPDEFLANENLTTKGYDLPDEFFANKKLSLNDDGPLTELLALAIKETDFKDDLEAFFTDLKLPVDCGNNVQVPDIYGDSGNQLQPCHINANLVAPGNYRDTVDLQNFDTDVLPDFSFFDPPK